MLEPREKGIMATTLRYQYEVRQTKDYFDEIPDIKIPPDMLKLAEHILDSKAANFDPSSFEDRYELALVEFLKQKQAKIPVRTDKVVPINQPTANLMDALRRSIEESGKKPVAKSIPRPAAAKRSTGSRKRA